VPFSLIDSPVGILAVLAGVTSLFFFLEKKTGWKLFSYFPPLLFIYIIPVFLSNLHVIPSKSPVYDFMGANLLPMFITILLLDVDLLATVRAIGKGIFVMLLGTLGVVVGAVVAYFIVKSGLDPGTWKAFGALAGSWIGGTGNMLAVGHMLKLDESSVQFGYAVISDNAVYLIWLPIMLGSKNLAGWFHRFTGVSPDRIARMEKFAKEMSLEKGAMQMRHLLYLVFFGFTVTAIAAWLSQQIPTISTSDGTTIVSASTYKILIVTILGIALSFTRASKIPGSHAVAMAMVYLFVARMGAKADLSGVSVAVFWFLLGAYIWIFIHGVFLVTAARIFKVDVHTAAIASAANIGGAASAPVVAAHHNPLLVPVSVLMALVGYAIGNPIAYLTGLLCYWVS
jgi:uncharacterized membrane protein